MHRTPLDCNGTNAWRFCDNEVEVRRSGRHPSLIKLFEGENDRIARELRFGDTRCLSCGIPAPKHAEYTHIAARTIGPPSVWALGERQIATDAEVEWVCGACDAEWRGTRKEQMPAEAFTPGSGPIQ